MRKRKHSPEFLEQPVKQTLTSDESIKDRDAGLGIIDRIVGRDVGLSRRRSWRIARRTALEGWKQKIRWSYLRGLAASRAAEE